MQKRRLWLVPRDGKDLGKMEEWDGLLAALVLLARPKMSFSTGLFLSTLIETNEGEWKIIGNKAPEVVCYSSRCCDRKPGKVTRGRKGLLWLAAGESSPSRWRSLGSGEAGS